MGCTLGDTGGFQALVEPIHAVVALDHFVGCRIKLRYAPGAGTGAGHAADTCLNVEHDDAVLSFTQGAGWADMCTVGIIALVTAAKGEFGLGNPLD